jgi:hypothetical protein
MMSLMTTGVSGLVGMQVVERLSVSHRLIIPAHLSAYHRKERPGHERSLGVPGWYGAFRI